LLGSKVNSLAISNVSNAFIHNENIYFIHNGAVECWNINLSKLERTYQMNDRIICFNVYNDYLCCGSENGMCYLWTRDNEEPILSLKFFDSPITSVLFVYLETIIILGSESKLKIINIKKI